MEPPAGMKVRVNGRFFFGDVYLHKAVPLLEVLHAEQHNAAAHPSTNTVTNLG